MVCKVTFFRGLESAAPRGEWEENRVWVMGEAAGRRSEGERVCRGLVMAHGISAGAPRANARREMLEAAEVDKAILTGSEAVMMAARDKYGARAACAEEEMEMCLCGATTLGLVVVVVR